MNSKKIKIVFLCIYSKGICGVWARVRQMSEKLIKKGYEVHVLSTNKTKGSEEIAEDYENIKGIHIHRISPILSIGRNINFWFFYKKLKKINPDLIVAEVYRHPHTFFALRAAKKLNKPIFLTTHAPFVDKIQRTFLGRFIENFYDKFIGSKTLNSFDEIITITKWEEKHLKRLTRKLFSYIPNGIPEEFFKPIIRYKQPKNILYLGRIAPIKNLETLILAISLIKNKPTVKLVGPKEEEYVGKLNKLIKEKSLQDKITMSPPVFDLNQKIKLMNKFDIFVLPSKREAMPQTLIELMALGKIVIASKTQGAKEVIVDGKNGFLFEVDDEKQLADKIDFCMGKKNNKQIRQIQKNARKSVQKFKLDNIVSDFLDLTKKYAK